MTTDVHTLAEQARRMGYRTSEHIVNRLTRMIIRNESYLSRRRARGTHTPTDDAIAEDSAVAALVIELLQAEQDYQATCHDAEHFYTGAGD